MQRPPRATLIWSLLLVAAFAGQSWLASRPGVGPFVLVRLGANAPLLVADGEVFRLAVAAVLHAGAWHLITNLVGLVVLGAALERVAGPARLTLIAIASALGGGLASYLTAAASVSAGFSPAVYGLAGALAWVFLRRRRELSAGLWTAAALGGVLIALELVPGAVPGNVDHAAHLGGLAVGVALGVLLLGSGAHGVRAGPALRAITAAACIVFAAALAQAAYHASAGRASELRYCELLLTDAATSAIDANNAAFHLATVPQADAATLSRARDSMERIVAESPGLHPVWDTLATLHYRLGELDPAIRAEREALAREDLALYASQLAYFERARVERDGVLRHGPVSELPELAREGETLRVLPRALPEGALHVLVLDGDRLAGHLEIALGPDPEPAYRLEVSELPAGARLTLALVDARHTGLAARAIRWRLRPIDPEVAGLHAALRARADGR